MKNPSKKQSVAAQYHQSFMDVIARNAHPVYLNGPLFSEQITDTTSQTTGEPVTEQAPTVDPDTYSLFIDKAVFEECPPCVVYELFESVYLHVMTERPSYAAANSTFYVTMGENGKINVKFS